MTWSKDVSILNDLLDWLGYKECHFQSIENHDGFGVDQTEAQMSDECHYPH